MAGAKWPPYAPFIGAGVSGLGFAVIFAFGRKANPGLDALFVTVSLLLIGIGLWQRRTSKHRNWAQGSTLHETVPSHGRLTT
jgi:hypothetical protein